ncbi:helix-turn-helix domain-containing protein [Thioalkalivibrio sp. ALMg11]|uniref:helix-turn-helix domain-containing protein n=1 Tax=Thioalkalivibrio sp. ALMg11 TaxID=1158165 RepID=UPI000370FA55|nr:helix-turn-helix domain-containing protein [Thioalkalivibrio sp. ALMg11]
MASKPRVSGKLTPEKKQKVVELLSQTGNLSACAAEVGLSRDTIYRAMQRDEEFATRIAQARDKASYEVEREIRRRGLEGISRPVYYQGEIIGEQKEYSDKLLLAMAKANMPERYSDKQYQVIDHSIKVENSAKVKLANLLGIEEEGVTIDSQDADYKK